MKDLFELNDVDREHIEHKEVKQIIENSIAFIANNLPFDRNDFRIVYKNEISIYYEGPYVMTDSNIDEFVEKALMFDKVKMLICIQIQDVRMGFQIMDTNETLKKYCDDFIRLAKKSKRFKFAKMSDCIPMEVNKWEERYK